MKKKEFEKMDAQTFLITTKQILSFREALVYLDISESSLYKLTSNREITFTKPNNGKIYFKRTDLDNWMLSNEHKSKSDKMNFLTLKMNNDGTR
ncbi:helix-turn-helix domain-containing protein [Capnocytophaga sp. ARDL2]|uniref:helix-turn-helix domain-containing protein n=1 Tax=Capnocytophaga sp. ARDL2 TaxID=3238809 RepID=UPI00355871F3